MNIKQIMKSIPCIQPDCDLHGNIPERGLDGDWEATQCQFCFEVRFPIRDAMNEYNKVVEKMNK